MAITNNGAPRPDAPVLEADHVTKHFKVHGARLRRGPARVVHAVEDVSIALHSGRITALVGESGSGKSTLARLLAQLYPITSGQIKRHGVPVKVRGGRKFRQYVSAVQLILQDPFGSFNPVARINTTLMRAVRIHHPKASKAERQRIINGLLEQVNLVPPRQFTEKFPHELSGGQLQRVCVARAIATDPKLIVLDEPTSSLDLSVRAGILELLAEIRAETGAGMLFITHDLGTLKLISDEVVVLYLGSVMEHAPTAEIFEQPAHPYTRALISAHLSADPGHRVERIRLEGEIPSPISLPPGCPFASRCFAAVDACRDEKPELMNRPAGPGHAACIRLGRF